MCLYMFRALCAHHREVKTLLYSIWYHQTCRWLSGAQVRRELVGRVDVYNELIIEQDYVP